MTRRGAASLVLGLALVGLAALLTVVILMLRVMPGWGEGEQDYPRIEAYLVKAGMMPTDLADGTSHTILFAERYRDCAGNISFWGSGANGPGNPAFAFLPLQP